MGGTHFIRFRQRVLFTRQDAAAPQCGNQWCAPTERLNRGIPANFCGTEDQKATPETLKPKLLKRRSLNPWRNVLIKHQASCVRLESSSWTLRLFFRAVGWKRWDHHSYQYLLLVSKPVYSFAFIVLFQYYCVLYKHACPNEDAWGVSVFLLTRPPIFLRCLPEKASKLDCLKWNLLILKTVINPLKDSPSLGKVSFSFSDCFITLRGADRIVTQISRDL